MSQLDELYKRMNDDLELSSPEEESEIQKFFTGKTLFISGATGFLGKCLVQKLLKSCYDLKHIYILMRVNKNKSVDDLLKEYFQNEIFDSVRNIHPKFETKVTAIKGDLSIKNLGLSEDDKKMLINEVNIIYHSGACVYFHKKLSSTLNVNVLGTERMLNLAKDCLNLEIFVYISSAYSHCYNRHIEEKFYPISLNIDKIKDLISVDDKNDLAKEDVKKLIGKFPNVYTYSKALSEALVEKYAENSKFACAVYRPSIITPTHKEPLPGWTCNLNGPMLVFLGTGLGIIHTNYLFDYPIDFVPCDLTVNALLAVTWDHCNRTIVQAPAVYNYGSSSVNPTSIKRFIEASRPYRDVEAFTHAAWLCFGGTTSSKISFWISHILFHFLPACLVDLYFILLGKKPKALAVFMKANRNLDDIFYFGNGNWRIYMFETLKAIDRLNATDKEIFYCDIRNFDWEIYCFRLVRGMRLHVLKENLNSNENHKKHVKLWYMHYGLVTISLLIFIYFLCKLF